ncbi:hypothetical protein RHIZO_02084 [Rhizobiaceae bacterium]|nr:hypothetical protein RHIZO_02084 [Rhizobiaceae bacterium]
MLFRLVSSVKRKGSRNRQFVQRIPADLKARVTGLKLEVPIGTEIVPFTISPQMDALRFSLRTSDPAEARKRQAEVASYIETVWQAQRSARPVSITHRQATALAGELHRAWAGEKDERTIAAQVYRDEHGQLVTEILPADPTEGQPGAWEALLSPLASVEDAEDLERWFGTLLDRMLLRKGIGKVDEGSRTMVLAALRDGLRDAVESRMRNAGGDYSPDSKASRFPEWEQEAIGAEASPKKVSLRELVERWWGEAQKAGRSRSTYESYRAIMARFVAHVGHDDANAVRPSDVVSYKDARLAAGVSPKTVGDSDVSCLRAVFAWAVANQLLANNPAEGVKVTRTKASRTRGKEFTPEEASAILSHCRSYKRGREKPKTYAAKRWVPWLCAYTGARLGEMVQLRKQDVRRDGDCWIVTITPEAGTVKDKELREVVLHEHLIETGFADYVTSAPAGYLFLDPPPNGDVRGVWRSIKNRVTEFVREVATDPRVAPNHGWRHLFKTVGREAGIADSVLDAICGHASRTVGGSYGGVTLKAQADAMRKFPRFGMAAS